MGVVYLLVATPIYAVRARLMVEKRFAPLEVNQEDAGLSRSYLSTQAEVIRSPVILAPAIKAVPDPMPRDPTQDPLTAVFESLTVLPVSGADVLSVSFRHSDADYAVRLVQAIIENYQRHHMVAEQSANLDALRLLSENADKLRRELTELENDYRRTRAKNPVPGEGQHASLVQQMVSTHLAEMLAQTKSRRLDLENQLRAAQEEAAGPAATHGPTGDSSSLWTADDAETGTAARRPRVASVAPHAVSSEYASSDVGRVVAETNARLEEKYWEAQRQVIDLKKLYGSKRAAVRTAEAEVAMWKELLEKRPQIAESYLRRELKAVQSTEKDLYKAYQQELAKARELESGLLKEKQLTAQIQRLQQIFDSTLTKLNELRVADQALAEGRAGVVIGVLESPVVPEEPIWPKPFLVLAICAFVGLAGGVGLLQLVPRRDQRSTDTPRRAASSISPGEQSVERQN